MIMRNFGILFIRGLFVFLVLYLGCTSVDKEPLLKQKYSLNVGHSENNSGDSISGVLKVRRFRIASDFEGTGLVYRTGEVNYESDFYNEFLSSPTSLITEVVRNRLETSKVFENVTDDTSIVESKYTLEGKVLALYGDYVTTDEPRAVVDIMFSIINNKKQNTIAFQNTYRTSEEIDTHKPADLVRGFNHCIEKILIELEQDLRESFQ